MVLYDLSVTVATQGRVTVVEQRNSKPWPRLAVVDSAGGVSVCRYGVLQQVAWRFRGHQPLMRNAVGPWCRYGPRPLRLTPFHGSWWVPTLRYLPCRAFLFFVLFSLFVFVLFVCLSFVCLSLFCLFVFVLSLFCACEVWCHEFVCEGESSVYPFDCDIITSSGDERNNLFILSIRQASSAI